MIRQHIITLTASYRVRLRNAPLGRFVPQSREHVYVDDAADVELCVERFDFRSVRLHHGTGGEVD
jgi:hypothetical protein